MTTLDYAPNFTNLVELDVTPDNKVPTWAWAQVGMTECSPESDETTSEDAYLHLLGQTETNIDKVKVSISLSGHRLYGDPCQDFVSSRVLLTGKGRKTRYRWTMPDGTVLFGACTLSDITPGPGTGDSGAKSEFKYKINLDSVESTGPVGDDAPESVTCAAVTVAVGKSVASAAKVTPATASPKCHYAVADTDIATVDRDGVIRGVKAGKTMMTIKAASKPAVYAQCDVTVSEATAASK